MAQSTNDLSSAELLKKGYKVLKESNRQVVINTNSLDLGQKILFVRYVADFDEYEVISQGSVKKKSDKFALVQIDIDRNEKFPKPGDYAVTLGEPKIFIDPPKPTGQEGFQAETKKLEPTELGYAELGLIQVQGDIQSESSNRVNSYKNVNSLKYSGLKFSWIPEFLPNYGFEYESYSGPVIVKDYNMINQPSTFNKTQIKLLYRNTKKPENQLRWKIFITTSLSDFITENQDEYVITSKNSGFGLGGYIGYDWIDKVDSQPRNFWGTPESVGLSIHYLPQVTVSDGTKIQRGQSSSGSNQMILSANYTHHFFFDFMPWLQRYFVDISYSVQNLKINFSGDTKNIANNFYPIPQNGTYAENEKLIKISFGLKMEDWFGRALKPRDK